MTHPLVQALPDPESARATAEKVLMRPEFQRQQRENPFYKWLKDFFAENDSLGNGLSFITDNAEVIAWVVLGIAVLVALRAALLFAKNRPQLEVATAAPLAERIRRVEDILETARAHEAQGESLEALRLYFFALVLGLGERGDLEFRDAWTPREMLERGNPDPAVVRELLPVTAMVTSRSFGGEPVLEADLRTLDALCRRWLETARDPALRAPEFAA